MSRPDVAGRSRGATGSPSARRPRMLRRRLASATSGTAGVPRPSTLRRAGRLRAGASCGRSDARFAR
ncbi:hypothetical protein [Ornithinimicrobium kibberense]|uniref:hypothetical protein n=1 Tax=Ornithinimicrobium kibberense TaxID=282060 RepID=UPI00362188A1